MDGTLQKWKRLPAPAPALQTVVFGERLRTKATRLAARGCSELLYATDPQLAQTRTAPDFLERNRAALERLWQALEDTESRLVLASIVRQRITGELGYLRVSQFAEYCHPAVKAEPGETVIDAGAFNGATSASFARRVGRRGLVYAFEPGTDNRRLIQRRLRLPWNWLLRVEIVPQAISDSVGNGYFEAGRGGSGTLREATGEPGVEPTPLTTLDHFASTRGKIDLISLDIEGAEPAALAGADRLIGEQRPKLQVSVYHALSHLFEIPLLLRDKYPDYALFLGHHDVYSTETDAYLVPRERLRA
jgi:FkbM family methyltransferase